MLLKKRAWRGKCDSTSPDIMLKCVLTISFEIILKYIAANRSASYVRSWMQYLKICSPAVLSNITLREKRPYSEFFWSVFSHIRTEYRPEKLRIRTVFMQ